MWLFVEDQRSGVFLYAVLCGLVIGGVYDVFRIMRAVWCGGRTRMFFDDVLFCVLSAILFAVFCFNASFGVVRLFLALGVLFGFFTYRFSIGLLTVPLVKKLKAFIRPYFVSMCCAVKTRVERLRSLRYTQIRISKISNVIN